MSESNQIIAKTEMTIPGFGNVSPIHLDLSNTREAEIRLIEAKMVNPSTYSDLEYCFNEAYRELRGHLGVIQFQITLTDKAMERAKSDVLLDKYPDFLVIKTKEAKEKGVKFQDSADNRTAFLMRDESYLAALDRMNMLKVMENYMDARIKSMEKTCSYMKLQMNLILRSGLSNTNLYNTQGKK